MRGATTILLIFGVLGAVAAAHVAGSIFDLSMRQRLFPAALVLGLTLLVLLRSKGPRQRVVSETLDDPSGRTAVQPVTTVARLVQEQDVLSAEAARQWLDDFLLEQQK
jgi:hypothetical protein